MKDTGKCPKCKGAPIIYLEGKQKMPSGYIKVKTNEEEYVQVDRYVCSVCGFMEEWIPEPDLARLRAMCNI